MEKNEIVYGIHPVKEVLNSNRKVIKLFIKKTDRISPKIGHILTLAQVKDIQVKHCSKEEILKYAAEGVHQGVVALIAPEKKASSPGVDYDKNLYLVIDHITDVQNLGAILRSAEFFKVDGVILPKDRSASINETVKKTSAGAVFHLNIISVSNIGNEIDKFKKKNFWIIGADNEAEDSIYKFEFPKKTVLIIGNEETGISRLLKEKMDYRIQIPRFGQTESLNVSVASALFLFQYRKGFS